MFASLSEKTMRLVRALLATGFVAVIALLLWNPRQLSALRTPGSLGPAGFLFWSLMLFAPAFLLVFGHEAWRRICPLSALSQIPRRLGLSRTHGELDRETGLVGKKLALIPGASWLGRNAVALQFSLLLLAVMLRVALLNSNRLALGIFLAAIVCASILVGLAFGGKTWCNYFCPVSPVQRFYTGPRGLFESRAHLALTVVTGSMCRDTDATGRETSACVGCASPCPDVDLERSYWAALDNPARGFAMFGYAGLVAGYVAVVAFGRTLPGPRIVAPPLTVLASALLACVLGLAITKAAARGKEPARARHVIFALTTFVTFNVLYLLGANALLSLAPPPVRALFQFAVIFASSLWLVQSLSRSSERYERESLGGKLRKQLRKLSFDPGKVLGGRTIDELEPDEVYLLARALPELSSQQRSAAYKETLRESITSGSARTVAGAAVLRDLRQQLGVSEEEHGAALTELGIEDPRLLEPEQLQSHEAWLRLESYRTALEGLVLELVRKGAPVQQALRDEGVREQVRALQQLYEVGKEDQERVASELLGADGRLAREMNDLLARVAELGSRGEALASVQEESAETPVRLLLLLMAQRRREVVLRALALLSASGPTTAAIEAAEKLAHSAPDDLELLLKDPAARDWSSELSAGVLAVLRHRVGAVPLVPKSPVAALTAILHEPEPIARAAALQALALVDPSLPRAVPEGLLAAPDQHWLVRETAESLSSGVALPIFERIMRLSEVPLFARLAPELLAKMARESATRALQPRELICEQGAKSSELLLLSNGEAEVLVQREGKPMIVARLSPGQIIGELGVLTKGVRSATVRAAESGAEVVALPAERFEALLQDSRVATGLLRTVSDRLAQTLSQLSR